MLPAASIVAMLPAIVTSPSDCASAASGNAAIASASRQESGVDLLGIFITF
jgi:hypothetical protein